MLTAFRHLEMCPARVEHRSRRPRTDAHAARPAYFRRELAKVGVLRQRVAASPLVTRETRVRLYRRWGLKVQTNLVYPRCYFHTANISIGEGALVNYGVHIENVARVEIGRNSALGAFATVLTSDHELGPPDCRCGTWKRRPVTIGPGCWVGAGSLILPGVTIGHGCVVAAGALVRTDCEPNGLYAGVPARRIKDLPDIPTVS